jgi:hypothetical protein
VDALLGEEWAQPAQNGLGQVLVAFDEVAGRFLGFQHIVGYFEQGRTVNRLKFGGRELLFMQCKSIMK